MVTSITTSKSKSATLVATSLAFAIVQLDVTVVNVAVKQIGASLHGGVSELQWVVGAYTLAFAAFILSAGGIADRLGARRVLCAGFAIFVTASIACAVAPAALVLILARAAQGVGAALLGSCSLALLSHTFTDPGERASAVGLWAAGASGALSAGPVVGGVLIAAFGWRAIFLINVPIGLAGAWLTARYARETPAVRDRGLDLAGQAVAVLGLAALAAATIEAGRVGFTAPLVLTGLALAALAAVAFALIERRAPAPLLPLSLLTRRAFTWPALIGLLVNVCFYGLIFVFSLLLQTQHGYDALRAGLAFLPMTAAIMAANLGSGRAVRALGARRVILSGLVAMAAGCAALMWIAPTTPFGAIVGQQLLLGAGLGVLVPPMTSSVLAAAPRGRAGVAAGTLNTMRQTGSLLGIAVFGSLIAGPGRFFAGMHVALVISMGVLCAAGLLTGSSR